ncbi:Flp family type IVb pilin [Phycicoccus sp. CMS6Z-2]|nr:Flp family type IVb pilin [Phycicoccus flavus]
MTLQLTRLLLAAKDRRETGATAVEYALMVTFIALIIITAVILLGSKLSSVFSDAADKI